MLVFHQHVKVVFGSLIAHLGGLFHLLDFTVDLLQILDLQLKLHDLDVAHGVNGAFHVGEVLVVEAAQHMDECVALAHVGEEAVADAFALTGAFSQARHIHHIHSGINQLVGSDERVDFGQTLVGHVAHTDIRLVGTVGEIGDGGLSIGDAIEHSGLTCIGKADDATFQTHKSEFRNLKQCLPQI